MTSTAFSSTRVRVTSFRSQEHKLKRYSFLWLTALTRSTPLTKPLKLWTHGRLWYWINQVKELTTCTVLRIWSGLNICFTFDQLFTINFLFSPSKPTNQEAMHVLLFTSHVLPAFSSLLFTLAPSATKTLAHPHWCLLCDQQAADLIRVTEFHSTLIHPHSGLVVDNPLRNEDSGSIWGRTSR